MVNVNRLIDTFHANAAYERYQAAVADRLAAINQLRPSVIYDVSVSEFQCPITGADRYVADYSGIMGVGSTPAEACLDFDRAWLGVN